MSQDQGSGQANQSSAKPRESGMLPGETGFVLLVSLAILAIGFWALFQRTIVSRSDSELLTAVRQNLAFHLVVNQAMSLPELEPVNPKTELTMQSSVQPGRQQLYYKVRKEPELLGTDVSGVVEGVDDMGGSILKVDLTPEGTKIFAECTGKHVGEQLAIVIRGSVVSAPTIQSTITGGKVQVTGANMKELVMGLKP